MLTPSEEIKTRLDIVEVVQSYIKTQKAGVNFKANCPFHGEKTPSFFISPVRQIWHCFGCGRGGDIFKFIMEIEGMDFLDALRLLAARAGVALKQEDFAARSEKSRLLDVCEEATKIFQKNLFESEEVKKYLKQRGVKDQTANNFRVGYAVSSWDALWRALNEKKFTRDEIAKAGLLVKNENGKWYDRFRSRIIFPIFDYNSRVIGFGGRIFGNQTEGQAKYVNSPTTEIYDKSRVLYGFDKAKQEIRGKNSVVITEGYMDCMMSHQAGVKNTVAVSGTALTMPQLTMLKRLCGTIIASFDSDAAGETATKRSLAMASQYDFERKVIDIPSGKDPADTVLENPKLWLIAVESAEPVVNFFFAKALKNFDPATSAGKIGIAKIVLPYVAELTSEIEKAHWIKEIAKVLGINEEAVAHDLAKIKISPDYLANEGEPVTVKDEKKRKDILEEQLIMLLPLSDKHLISKLPSAEINFNNILHQEIYTVLTQDRAVSSLSNSAQNLLESLRFKGEIFAQMSQNISEEIMLINKEFQKECIREKLLKISEEIRANEARKDSAKIEVMLKNFKQLSDKLKSFE